jgi:hypothetical protein
MLVSYFQLSFSSQPVLSWFFFKLRGKVVLFTFMVYDIAVLDFMCHQTDLPYRLHLEALPLSWQKNNIFLARRIVLYNSDAKTNTPYI